MMEIRSTEIKDLPLVMEIYDYARAFMRATGNTTQWIDGYPSEVLIRQEIEEGHSFVCADEQGVISGTFCFILGDDPTYQHIYEGAWLNDEPYGVVHRLAGVRKARGFSESCFTWVGRQCGNLKIDTHQENRVMQHVLEKHGFVRRGIIYTDDGTPRIAYEYFA